MANTYTQLGIHVVTAVKHRQSLIDPLWRPRIHSLSRQIITARKHAVVNIHAQPDHIHLFYDAHPAESVSALVGAWKAQLSGFITREFGIEFEFQRGYGAFAVSKRDWPTVSAYLDGQDLHHQNSAFKTEYLRLLHDNDIDFDPDYLFMWVDED